MSKKLNIEIVSDVVCPWCVVGYRQLRAALQETGIEADIHWRPFELNPALADEGEDLREHLARKYGTTLEGSVHARERLTRLGANLGFRFNFTDDMRIVNTWRAHQLMAWADETGHKHDLKLALFDAYFTHNKNINHPPVLVRIAERVGLDGAEAAAVLEDERYAASVREEEQVWRARGIHGVPAMLLDGKYLVSGAQGVDTFSMVLRQVVGAQDAA